MINPMNMTLDLAYCRIVLNSKGFFAEKYLWCRKSVAVLMATDWYVCCKTWILEKLL